MPTASKRHLDTCSWPYILASISHIFTPSTKDMHDLLQLRASAISCTVLYTRSIPVLIHENVPALILFVSGVPTGNDFDTVLHNQ
jgi:hypothetical protein